MNTRPEGNLRRRVIRKWYTNAQELQLQRPMRPFSC
jgi:hypothetical protein